MKKISRRDFLKGSAAAAAVVTGGSVFAGCSSSSSEESSSNENAISDLVLYVTTSNEVEDFCVQHSQSAKDTRIMSNLVSGLCAADENSQLVPAIATSWEQNEDATEWTFHLRDDVVWVNRDGEEMAPLTAQDFVCGLEWTLNRMKNEDANTSMLTEMIAGAEEYNSWTGEGMDEDGNEIDMSSIPYDNERFMSTVGVETPDDYTIVYKMLAPKPYFYTLASYVALYPVSPAQMEIMTAEEYRGVEPDTLWYCGPYILTEYINGSEKVFEPNSSWFDADGHLLFESMTQRVVDSTDSAFTLYQSGDLDQVTLSESAIASITEDSEYYDYMVETRRGSHSYQIKFCYDKCIPDSNGEPDDNWNKAIANEAFRLCWLYGLDLSDWYKRTNAINPLKCENNCYTMSGLVSTSDGRDYTELVTDNLIAGGMNIADYDGVNMRRLDREKAAEYKEQAMSELAAIGVEFPVQADYYISASSATALDNANVLSQAFKESFGDEFIQLRIQTYVSSVANEVRIPRYAAFYINGWGADYGDPINFVGQETFGDPNAYYSTTYTAVSNLEHGYEDWRSDLVAEYEEYTTMVKSGDAIVDNLDDRYVALAEAEAYFILHGLDIPCYYSQEWQLTKINDYSKPYMLYGSVGEYYYVDWETNVNGYTTADYEAFAAAAGEI